MEETKLNKAENIAVGSKKYRLKSRQVCHFCITYHSVKRHRLSAGVNLRYVPFPVFSLADETDTAANYKRVSIRPEIIGIRISFV